MGGSVWPFLAKNVTLEGAWIGSQPLLKRCSSRWPFRSSKFHPDWTRWHPSYAHLFCFSNLFKTAISVSRVSGFSGFLVNRNQFGFEDSGLIFPVTFRLAAILTKIEPVLDTLRYLRKQCHHAI